MIVTMRRGIRSVLRTAYRWHNQHVISSSIEVDALVSQRHMGLLSTGCGCPSPNLLHNAWQDSRAFCSQAAATADEVSCAAPCCSTACRGYHTLVCDGISVTQESSTTHHPAAQQATTEATPEIVADAAKFTELKRELDAAYVESRAHHLFQQRAYRETADILIDFFIKVRSSAPSS